MNPVPVIVSGVIAGLVGAAFWAAIAYNFHLEIGWIAVIIGTVVGLACCAAAKGDEGAESALIAVLITLLALVGGKYATVHAVVNRYSDEDLAVAAVADHVVWEFRRDGQSVRFPKGVNPEKAIEESEYPADVWVEATRRWSDLSDQERADIKACPNLANPDFVLSIVADEVVGEWTAAGKTIMWPEGVDPDEASHAEDYTRAIWGEATKRWDAMTADEQRAKVDEQIEFYRSIVDAFEDGATWTAFKGTFGFADTVFFGFAGLAAYATGAGLRRS